MRFSLTTPALLASAILANPAVAQDALGPVAIGDGVNLDPIVDIRFRVETADQPTFPDAASSVSVPLTRKLRLLSRAASATPEKVRTSAASRVSTCW